MANFDSRLMWFGTIQRMGWIPAPQSGADATPQSFGTGGSLVNGQGYERNARGSHKVYVYEWAESSAATMAQKMASFRNGTFGTGLLYFLDPNTYNKNVLPARWANPEMACDYEGTPHVYGVEPTRVSVSGGDAQDYPVASASYNLGTVTEGYRSNRETIFIPIPEGYTAYVGCVSTHTGTGGVYVSPVAAGGAVGASVLLTEVGLADTNLVPDGFSGSAGIRLWFGKSASGAATVTVTAITVRLYRTGETPPASFFSGPWIGGMGHSGCRISGTTTYVSTSGIDDGKAQFAATFRETGDSE